MKYDIHIIGAEVYYLPVHMRLPMKFGAETVDYVTCARARIKVAGTGGKTAEGWGETPLSVTWGWPSVVRRGTVDREHFISGIDFFPTVLEAVGLPIPKGLDGFSFLPLLKGEKQPSRDKVFTQIDMKAGGDAVPMRCVQDKSFGYIFSPWSDGKFYYRNNNEGLTMKAMVEAAQTDPYIAQRVRMFRYRAAEELYDHKKDSHCLNNLVGESDYKSDLKKMQGRLHDWMKQTDDPLLPAFENRNSTEKLKSTLIDIYGDNYVKAAQGRKNISKGNKKTRKNRNR